MNIERITQTKDIKNFSLEEMETLALEIREGILNRVSKIGGHLGPNLGIVEATIALHYVFDLPEDKIVFDVSHQSYAHKMLSGRWKGYFDESHFDEVSGYTNPEESDCDSFVVGHTSTSVSLACGLAKGRDLRGGSENIIAVIGDGSLSGGEALEGLDFASELGSNLIIVVNDNQMSIAENHGGLYQNLTALRESNGTCECNFFKAMGLDYKYVAEGNNIGVLIDEFKKVKNSNYPVVIHINTMKGQGFDFAMTHKEQMHWTMPFDLKQPENSSLGDASENYDDMTCEYFLEKMKKDKSVVALAAAVPVCIGFTADKRALAGEQFVDVGICEEHAVAMASGIAKNGGKPVFATNSSFMQRAFDQISQDLCINSNPATLLINTASVYGMNDITHLGIFDIPLMSNIPNLVYLAPTNCEEYFAMLDWSIEQDKYPVAVRIPCNGVIHTNVVVDKDYSNLNKYQITRAGEAIAIIALGDFYQIGEALADMISEKTGKVPTLINPRYITGLDDELLNSLEKNHTKVITLEDGILDGGFGEKIARFFGASDVKVYNYGLKKEFLDRYDVAEVLKKNRITPELICEDVL